MINRFNKFMLLRGLTAIAVCVVAMLSMTIQAQSFPNAPVTFVVPGPAGSGTDQIARLLADQFTKMWNQSVVVENRAGASGSLGVQMLMRAKPDGYTFMIGHVSTHGIVPALRKPKPYDPFTDFAPIGEIGSSSNILVITPEKNIKTLNEWVEVSKKKNTVSYGSPGIGLSQHFDGYSFGKKFDVEVLHIPYKGTGPAVNDLLGGRIDMMFVTPPAVMPLVNSGKLVALAQTSETRQKAFSNVPTFKELGYDELVNKTWWGLFAPLGTPKNIIEKLNESLLNALKNDAVRKGLELLVVDPSPPKSSAEFGDFVRKDYQRWVDLVQQSGITVN
ncbi:PBP2_Bug_TTT domain containing protein [Burkholderiaceae bacterium]